MSEASDALSVARSVAREAAEVLRGVDEVGEVRTKSTFKDLVTEWDTRVDALIAERLERLTRSRSSLQNAPPPTLAKSSQPSAGACTTPAIGSPSRSSEMQTA